MKILYSVTEVDGAHRVEITPETPVNGFHGATLTLRGVPKASADTFIKERVSWKVKQELPKTDKLELVKV